METKASSRWEHFEHKADMGIRGIGTTLEDAFVQAARGLTAVIIEPARVEPQIKIEVNCQAPDRELLLADWLNAIIFEMATRKMLFGQFEVTLSDNTLSANLYGETADALRHKPAVEIKGATYTALSVYQDADGLWYAQCVVDV